MKFFAAQLLFEEYLTNTNTQKSFADSVIYSFIVKRGSSKIIEYIKTGKHAPLEMIAEFSRASIDVEECSVNNLVDVLSYYRNRYKNEDYPKFYRVGITTLFTFYWQETVDTILFAKKLCKSTKNIHVGGMAASLVPDYIEKETGISPHVGLLNEPYSYDKDKKGNVIIDELPLDYSILEEIYYRYPAENACII